MKAPERSRFRADAHLIPSSADGGPDLPTGLMRKSGE
jgi:hypothetical protein